MTQGAIGPAAPAQGATVEELRAEDARLKEQGLHHNTQERKAIRFRIRDIVGEDMEALEAPKQAQGVPTEEGWYILGSRPYGGQPPPRHAPTFAGLSWPGICRDENPVEKSDGFEYNQNREGQRVFVTEQKLQDIRDGMGHLIVRTRSEKLGKYAVVAIGGKTYGRALKGDVPFEKFLYMIPADPPVGMDDDTVVVAGEDLPGSLG